MKSLFTRAEVLELLTAAHRAHNPSTFDEEELPRTAAINQLARFSKGSRASHLPKEKDRMQRFSNSRRPIVKLKPGKKCSLKEHYRGALRELIGILDLLAANDPERFVFAGVDALVERCKKFKSKTKYGRRQIEHALAEFRAHYIVSKRLRRVRDGVEREGYIVTPHDCLCVGEGDRCVFKGQGHVTGKWEREFKEGVPGPVFWAKSAGQSADKSAVKSAEPSADKSADGVSVQTIEDANTYPQKRSANLCNHSTGGTPLTGEPREEPRRQGEHDDESRRASPSGMASVEIKSMNDETIGAHFGLPWPVAIAAVDPELNTATEQWEEFGIEKFSHLEKCCWKAVQNLAALPYTGPASHALVMEKAWNLSGAGVPSSWIRRMNELRGTARQKANMSHKPDTA
jgi:hypothetical protein